MANEKSKSDDHTIEGGDSLWLYHRASQDICRILSKIYEGHTPLALFESFVEMCHIALDGLPHLLRCAVKREPLQDTPEVASAWQTVAGKFKPDTIQRMSEAFNVLLQATVLPDGTLSYADVVGDVYMEFLGKYRPRGQFFTPRNVADMMAQMTMPTHEIEHEFQRRLAAACESDPVLQAMSWTCAALAHADSMAEAAEEWFLSKVLPTVMPKVEPLRVLDPCVGSGVMLLAAAKVTPRWLIDIGFVKFYGIDLDQLCVRLARLNLRLYGIEAVVKPADLLTLAEAATLPWPHDKLYGGLIEAQQAGDEGQVELYRKGVDLARAQQLQMWEGLPLILDEGQKVPLRSQTSKPMARRVVRRDRRKPDSQLEIAFAETSEQVA